MNELEPPDVHHCNAAWGWLELGNRAEAWGELESITPENQAHAAVLDLRWALCIGEKKWDEAFRAAQQLLAVQPEDPSGWLHSAYALRRRVGGGLEQAQALLFTAAEKFPQEPVIAFNLACYACQLNQLDEARRWLQRACQIGEAPEIRALARADEDLKVLWPEIPAA